jgi:HNH endonuclease
MSGMRGAEPGEVPDFWLYEIPCIFKTSETYCFIKSSAHNELQDGIRLHPGDTWDALEARLKKRLGDERLSEKASAFAREWEQKQKVYYENFMTRHGLTEDDYEEYFEEITTLINQGENPLPLYRLSEGWNPCKCRPPARVLDEALLVLRDRGRIILTGKMYNWDITLPVPSSISPSLRFDVLKRDSYRCRLCGVSAKDGEHIRLEVDHITPRSRGGTHEIHNLWTLCWDCNRGKRTKAL